MNQNIGDIADIVQKTKINPSNFQQLFSNGNLIAFVDGGHWVNVKGTVPDGGQTWVKLYDSEVGYYEQLLSDFSNRCGANNYFIQAISQ